MSKQLAGQIVSVSFEDGVSVLECGLEDCECPEHEASAPPPGTYVTIRLDRDHRIGLTRAEVVIPDAG